MSCLPLPLRKFLYRRYRQAEIREHSLLYLFLELTRSCNLACRHCGSDCGAHASSDYLDTPSWMRLLEHVAESFTPLPMLVLTGGEPLLHPDFHRLTAHMQKLGFRWGLVSNGYALDEKAAERLRGHGLESVTLSVDGPEPLHDWLRGRAGSYVRVKRAIDALLHSGVPTLDVVTCVHAGNLGALDETATQLLEMGVSRWRLLRIFPAGRARDDASLQLDPEQTRRLLSWIGERRSVYKSQGLLLDYGCEGWIPLEEDERIHSQPFFCRSGVNVASILCDGTVTGCSNNHARFHQGHVLKDNFAWLWENAFQDLRGRSWLHSTRCAHCLHRSDCQGGSLHLWRDDAHAPAFCYMDRD